MLFRPPLGESIYQARLQTSLQHVTKWSIMADFQLLFDEKTTCMAQILHSLSYKVCSITLPKFNTFGLFILILGTSAIMDQTGCCYNVTTSETGL